MSEHDVDEYYTAKLAALRAELDKVRGERDEAEASATVLYKTCEKTIAQRYGANTLLREARELLGVSHLTRNNELRTRIAKHLGD